MDIDVDHYAVLGLPSGEEGAKLTEKEISKAYRSKALELHPDKRPDDPNAHINFQKLKTSYEVLKDEKARKLFDDLLRVKRDKVKRQSQQDLKRRKMMSDLEERERAAYDADPSMREREEEDRIARKLKEEIARIRSMFTNQAPAESAASKKATKGNTDGVGGSNLDKEKILKVSWEKIGEGYTSKRLRELFEKFGEVDDVVINSSKKKGSALVAMVSKDAAAAVIGNVLGDLSNPLLVLPYKQAQSTTSPISSNVQKDVAPDAPKLNNLVGAGYQEFENSVLEKLKKAAQSQKQK